MIRARVSYTLDTLLQTVIDTREEGKLEHFEKELEKALGKVRNERFKLRQENFKKLQRMP